MNTDEHNTKTHTCTLSYWGLVPSQLNLCAKKKGMTGLPFWKISTSANLISAVPKAAVEAGCCLFTWNMGHQQYLKVMPKMSARLTASFPQRMPNVLTCGEIESHAALKWWNPGMKSCVVIAATPAGDFFTLITGVMLMWLRMWCRHHHKSL